MINNILKKTKQSNWSCFPRPKLEVLWIWGLFCVSAFSRGWVIEINIYTGVCIRPRYVRARMLHFKFIKHKNWCLWRCFPDVRPRIVFLFSPCQLWVLLRSARAGFRREFCISEDNKISLFLLSISSSISGNYEEWTKRYSGLS